MGEGLNLLQQQFVQYVAELKSTDCYLSYQNPLVVI